MGVRKIIPFLLVCLSLLSLPSIAKAGDIYVVSVGISNYKEIPDLGLPENDAKAIAELYKTKTKNVILITGRYATKAKIIKSIKDQFSRAKENDMIVLSFSGHGYPGGICPYDMSSNPRSGITYSEIRKILKHSRAKRKIIFADACFSGGIRGYNSNANSSSYKDSDVLLFLSSRTGEKSIESQFMANGFFTTYLLRGLRGGADTDYNRKITAKELFIFVSQGVKERSEDKQHPVMWGKFNDNYVLMDWSK